MWAATGLPERGGLAVWRAYELLEPDLQVAMRLAAGTALQLAADRRIAAGLGGGHQPRDSPVLLSRAAA